MGRTPYFIIHDASRSAAVLRATQYIFRMDLFMNENEQGGFVSTKVAAELLSLSEAAVRSRVSRGQIQGYKLGRQLRFKRTELIGLIKRMGIK